MTTGLVWDERYAWHDAGLASSSPWAEPYPALDRPETKRRLWSLLQASGLAARLTAIPARPAIEEELHRLEVADLRRCHQRRFAGRIHRIRIGPGIEQRLDHGRVAVGARQVNRRHAVAIHKFHVSAGTNQQLHGLDIVDSHHPVQRRRTVLAGGIHVGFLVDQSAQVIGDVQIGAQSSVWMNVVIRGDVNSIRIGQRTNVQDGTVVVHGDEGAGDLGVRPGFRLLHRPHCPHPERANRLRQIRNDHLSVHGLAS